MARTLFEYAEWLEERNLLWPAAPKAAPAPATPFLRPLPGIRAVTWSIYGTLLTISDGELLHMHPQSIRMQVALDKTIHEFNMWNSMTRKPGAPWEYMLQKYKNAVEEQSMAASDQKGEIPEINSALVWRKLLGMLEKKEYQYDEAFYGDLDELSEKVAYFFHLCLQGAAAAPHAQQALSSVAQ